MDNRNATYDFWLRCGKAIDEEASQDEIDALFVEAEGYRHIMRLMRSDGILREHTHDGLRKLRGWLALHMDNMGYASPTTNITNTATASANVSVSISQTFAKLEESSLSPEEVVELKASLADLLAAKEQGPTTFAEKLSKALNLAKSSATAAKAVMDFVAPMIQFVS